MKRKLVRVSEIVTKKMWVRLNEAGRVKDTAIGGKLDDGTEVEIPDGFELERPQDWRLLDGVLVHDPVTNA